MQPREDGAREFRLQAARRCRAGDDELLAGLRKTRKRADRRAHRTSEPSILGATLVGRVGASGLHCAKVGRTPDSDTISTQQSRCLTPLVVAVVAYCLRSKAKASSEQKQKRAKFEAKVCVLLISEQSLKYMERIHPK